MRRIDSALVVLVPDAEPLVSGYRERFDPAASAGVPAHITVLFPFIPPASVTPDILARLAGCFAAWSPLDYALAELRRFPDVLYLAPVPDAPFRELTRQVHALFPDYPPYQGAFPDVIPHLTLAHVAQPAALEKIAADFQSAHGGQIPLRTRAAAVTLIDNASGRWRARHTFPFGQPR